MYDTIEYVLMATQVLAGERKGGGERIVIILFEDTKLHVTTPIQCEYFNAAKNN